MKVDRILSGLGLSGDIIIIILLLVIIYYLHLINENLIVEGLDLSAPAHAAERQRAAAVEARGAAQEGATEAVDRMRLMGEVQDTVNRVSHGGGITLGGMSLDECNRQCNLSEGATGRDLNICHAGCTLAFAQDSSGNVPGGPGH